MWWKKAAELGWTSMFVPEAHGGGTLSGQSVQDAAMMAEEIGRTLAPGPFLPVNVVAAAVARSGSESQQATWLPGIASGEIIATWAYAERRGLWSNADVHATAEICSGEVKLNGTKTYVEALESAEVALVSARTGDGLTQVLVPLDAPGVTVRAGRSVDMTRRFGTLHLEDVRLPLDQVVGAPATAGDTAIYQQHLALILQCAELTGIAARTLEMTIDYGRARFAFGRPIVSFQVLKHRIADMTQWLESCLATCDAFAVALDAGADDLARFAHVLKGYVGDRAPKVVDECVQITGGIGVTWEHDIHMFNRRAILDRAIFGTPEQHRALLFDVLESDLGWPS
jgi:alkylation response protein AidB-like acyl-CoA dehydrogenase